MDRYNKNKIAQGFNRANDIKVSTKGKDAIESVAIAHLAQGNLDGFVTGMSTLNKIETEQAVENAEAICSTPGLTGIYVGPSDLAISMGEDPGLDRKPGKVYDAIQHVLIYFCSRRWRVVSRHTTILCYTAFLH